VASCTFFAALIDDASDRKEHIAYIKQGGEKEKIT